ncbi:MAG: hypothetical protein ABIP49_00025 [Lysobacterales bacterium]
MAAGEEAPLAALFANECHWRDILAFTWNLHTTPGATAIAERMVSTLTRMAPRRLQLAADRAPPRLENVPAQMQSK